MMIRLGLDTVNLQGWTKINLPHLNSPLHVFIKMADGGRRTVSSAHKELWSGWPEPDPKTQTNNY